MKAPTRKHDFLAPRSTHDFLVREEDEYLSAQMNTKSKIEEPRTGNIEIKVSD